MDLVRSLVHKRIKLGERHQIYTQGKPVMSTPQ